jgi:hypothetical protein
VTSTGGSGLDIEVGAVVIARHDGSYPVDARIRLVPAEPTDPFLRRLR